MLNATTIAGIASILVAFALFMAAFYFTTKKRTKLAVGLGIAAFLFMTLIPVCLAVFGAAANPGLVRDLDR